MQGQGMQGNMQGQGMMQGRGNGQGMQGQGMQGPTAENMELHLPAKSATAPTTAVIAAMKDGIADEQNAYAAYAEIIEQLGEVAPFTNIQRAEAHHIDAWSFLFDRYGLDVPKAQAATSTVKYASVTEACEAAAKVERDNITLYDDMLDTVKNYPDMVQIVTSLRTASLERHLPALEQCAGQ
ncbi:MAG: hypothetical protein IPK16_11765 [Anaerolineales bacterium]|nr:hypothetical protein [Anaerolineales bacterium]